MSVTCTGLKQPVPLSKFLKGLIREIKEKEEK
jgi:hypothetical protein